MGGSERLVGLLFGLLGNVVVVCRRFGGTQCLHIHGKIRIHVSTEVAGKGENGGHMANQL